MVPRPLSLFSSLLLAIAPVAAQDLPKPQAEHQKLAESAGTWDALIESFGANGERLTSKGVIVHKVGPGGFWLIDDFTGECMGAACTGHGALGYDPIRKVCMQSSVFSMSPSLMLWTGNFDEAGKVLTMTGETPGIDGTITRMRKVTTWASADAMTIEVCMLLPGGKELKTMTLRCTRRAKDAATHGAKK